MSDSVFPLGVVVDYAGKVGRIGYASNRQLGPIPLTWANFYTTQGQNAGALLVAGSAYSTTGNRMQIQWIIQPMGQQLNTGLFPNELNSHKTIPPGFDVVDLSNVPVGTSLSLQVNPFHCVGNFDDEFGFLFIEFL